MKQQTGSKLGKEYIKAVYCHPAYLSYMQNSVQSLRRVQLFVTPWTAAHQATLSIPNSWSLLRLMSVESVMHEMLVGYDSQAGIKIPERNINNLRYADDTSLMAESEEELKSLLMKVRVKNWLKSQHSKN